MDPAHPAALRCSKQASQTVLIAWGATSKQASTGSSGGRDDKTDHSRGPSRGPGLTPTSLTLDPESAGSQGAGSALQWARPGHLLAHLHPSLLQGPQERIRAVVRPRFPQHGRQRPLGPGTQDRVSHLPQGICILYHIPLS